MAGAIGGVGGGVGGGAGAIGGGMGSASVGGATAGTSSRATAPESAGKATAAPPSTVVKISDAAAKAMSEPIQEGANFSVSKDDAGHKYVGGLDQNGFKNPKISQYEQVAAMGGGSGGMSDLVAATLLALMQKNQHG